MAFSRIERGLMAADVVGQRFTQISNDFFRDPRLSAAAKGVFGFISTHRSGFGVTPELIAKHMRTGVTGVKAALRELERCGYLVREQTRNPDGTMGRSVYRITDMPSGLAIAESAPYPEQSFRRSEPSDGNPPTVNPSAGKPLAGDLPHKKTRKKNTSHKNTRSEEPPPPTSSEPGREHDGGRLQEEEGRLTASQDKQPTGSPVTTLDTAHVILDGAVEMWAGHRPPDPAERSRLVQRIVQALDDGASYTGILHALTRDLAPGQVRTSAVQVVMTRTREDGWAAYVPPAEQASAPSPRPTWCGKCSEVDRYLEIPRGDRVVLGPCPTCHPRSVNGAPR